MYSIYELKHGVLRTVNVVWMSLPVCFAAVKRVASIQVSPVSPHLMVVTPVVSRPRASTGPTELQLIQIPFHTQVTVAHTTTTRAHTANGAV